MGRPKKNRLTYFPIDTDIFDNKKIKLLRAKYSSLGFEMLIVLWTKIYGSEGNGYYLAWTDEESTLTSDFLNQPESIIEEIICYMVAKDIFNKSVFDRFSVLTSGGIQEQFLFIKKDTATINIVEDFACYESHSVNAKTLEKINFVVNPYLRVVIPEKPIVIPEKPTSKPEESAYSNSYTNSNTIGIEENPPTVKTDVPKYERPEPLKPKAPTLEDVTLYFQFNGFPDPVNNSQLFHNHYESTNWMKNGTPIVNWKPLANSWKLRGFKMKQGVIKGDDIVKAELATGDYYERQREKYAKK